MLFGRIYGVKQDMFCINAVMYFVKCELRVVKYFILTIVLRGDIRIKRTKIIGFIIQQRGISLLVNQLKQLFFLLYSQFGNCSRATNRNEITKIRNINWLL